MLMGSEIKIGWTRFPPLLWLSWCSVHNSTFCCHAPLQATCCSMIWTMVSWYTTPVDAVCTTSSSVAMSQRQQRIPSYGLSHEIMTHQPSWCSVHNGLMQWMLYSLYNNIRVTNNVATVDSSWTTRITSSFVSHSALSRRHNVVFVRQQAPILENKYQESNRPCLLLNNDQRAECLDPIHHGDMTSP